MRKVKTILSLIIALCLLNYCSDDSPTSPENSENILPLKSGNYWILKPSNTQCYRKYFKFIIGEQIKIDDNKYFKLIIEYEYKDENEINRDTSFIKTENNGIYYKLDFSDDIYLMFKYPVEIDDEWIPFSGDTISCVAKNKTINTPAGNFECIVYHETADDVEYSLSPGIGFITLSDDDRKYLLDSYELK